MAPQKSAVCYPAAVPVANSLAAEVMAAQDVVLELRRLLDQFSDHLATATRIFDETVSDTADERWIELCHQTGVAALWIAVADFRFTLEEAVERASGRDG
jgi:hypothetical protein